MISIKNLEILSNRKEEENLKFRSFLKNHADEEELDKQFKILHEKYFKIYDCSKCRNCCRKLGLLIEHDELDKVCEYLNIDKDEFIKNILIDKGDKYSSKSKKCLFLDGNTCKLEKCLPKSCIEYPYTNKEERLFSLYGIISNASICPVVYEILEELKKEYKFR